MITDTLKHANMYFRLSHSIKHALMYLQNTDFSKIDPGRYEIVTNDRIFAFVGEASYPNPVESCVWEAHRRYIDVQYMLEGCEYMGYALKETLSVCQAYDADADAELYQGKGDRILVPEGSFIIFFPQDGHMPGILADENIQSRKVVVKVHMDTLNEEMECIT